jgi:hypothetical protein
VSKETGGPAFPCRETVIQGFSTKGSCGASKIVDGKPDYQEVQHGGMTLRDYFAGQALAGMCANDSFDSKAENIRGAGLAAYLLADLLIKERDK